MKRGFWLITGIAIGVVAARKLAENPGAQAVVDDAARRAKEFGAAVADGFREREAEVKATPVRKSTAKKPAVKRPVAKKPAAKKN